MLAQLIECIEYAYTDAYENHPPELCFTRDRIYEVKGYWKGRGYILINDHGEEHTVGYRGDKWFDKHFRVIG